jgi:hypothetical protein
MAYAPIMQILSAHRTLHTEERLSPTLVNIFLEKASKDHQSRTAILKCGNDTEGALLFLLHGEPYAAAAYKKGEISPFPTERFQEEGERLQTPAVLYATSPVLFKLMLILGQGQPRVVGNSRVINMESLLESVEKGAQEHLLLLERDKELSLFYYREGKLVDGYFNDPARFPSDRGGLAEAMLVYLYQPGPPVEVRLYDLTEEDSSASQTQAADAGLLVLEVEKGAQKGTVFPLLPGKKLSLGRCSADIQIEDSKISRRHAEIDWIDGKVLFQDLKSTNGSFINEKRVTRHPLESGDVVYLGETVLRVKRQS